MRVTNAAKKNRRFNFSMCYEAAHYILSEQEKRIEQGLPHTDMADILNDWCVAMGQQLGFPPPRQHPNLRGIRANKSDLDQLETLARMAKDRGK